MSKRQKPRKPKARLRIVLPTGDTFRYKLSGAEGRIGTGPHADIPIADPEVSSIHARLISNGDGHYYLVDEGGEAGTFVNGERITEPRRLSNGDVVKLGKSKIVFKLKHGDKPHKAGVAPAASSGTTAEAEAPSNNGASESQRHKKHKKHEKQRKESDRHDTVGMRSASIDEDSETEKKNEKKKGKDEKKPGKEKKDERVKAAMVRAWGGIAGTVLSVILTVVVSFMLTRQSSDQPIMALGSQSSRDLSNLSDSTRIKGGRFEASGAVAVPDSKGILFVDDSRPDHVFYMPVNQLGQQDGPVKAIPLGVSVENPEGITQFGSRFMVIGSLSTHESNDTGGLAVFDFDPATQTVSRAAALTGMRKFLFDNVPELKAWANKTSAEGGLNIEGISVDPDPQHPRVLLGLRGPVLNGNALVVPIRILDRQAPLSTENLAMDEPNAIQLNLNGQAIRDIQYDSLLRCFLIISGAPEYEEKTEFALWEWSGESNQADERARPKHQALLDKKMKPEGIAPLKISNQSFVFIVGDAGSYAKIDYVLP